MQLNQLRMHACKSQKERKLTHSDIKTESYQETQKSEKKISCLKEVKQEEWFSVIFTFHQGEIMGKNKRLPGRILGTKEEGGGRLCTKAFIQLKLIKPRR